MGWRYPKFPNETKWKISPFHFTYYFTINQNRFKIAIKMNRFPMHIDILYRYFSFFLNWFFVYFVFFHIILPLLMHLSVLPIVNFTIYISNGAIMDFLNLWNSFFIFCFIKIRSRVLHNFQLVRNLHVTMIHHHHAFKYGYWNNFVFEFMLPCSIVIHRILCSDAITAYGRTTYSCMYIHLPKWKKMSHFCVYMNVYGMSRMSFIH